MARSVEGKFVAALMLLILELMIIASTFLPRLFLSFLFDVDPWGWFANVISIVFVVWMNAVMFWMIYRSGKLEETAGQA